MIENFNIKKYSHIFIDFDGVIKDSVNIKGLAFKELFEEYGTTASERIYDHHLSHGGISRYEKMPIYLDIVNEPVNQKNIEKFLNKFSKSVFKKVINSNWIPGAKVFLDKNYKNCNLILISATPQDEIEQILKSLNIHHFFNEVYGSPNTKTKVIKSIKTHNYLSDEEILVIGDTITDMEAAKSNFLDFLLIDFNGSFSHNIVNFKKNFYRLKDFSSLI